MPHAYFGLGLAYFMNHESPLVLEMITKLKDIGQEKLASQLENVIRGHKYIPEPAPLVDIPFQSEESVPGVIVKSGEKKKEVLPEAESSGGGITKIQMRGKLINVGDAEKSQESSDDTEGGQQDNASSVSSLRIEGDAEVITGEHYRAQRIRAMRKDY
jgi:hypothetical protein